jgi:hypothetical protein
MLIHFIHGYYCIYPVADLDGGVCPPPPKIQLCKLQTRVTRLAAASDKVYQLLAQGQYQDLSLLNALICKYLFFL